MHNGLYVNIEQKIPIPLCVSLDCAPGQMLAVVGPSGSGKSSLLRVIAGLMKAQGGSVRVGDQVWSNSAGASVPVQQRQVGMVFQQYALMPHLSAWQNVALAVPSKDKEGARALSRQLLDRVGLAELAERKPVALSGGQQQRVALARALARRPKVLLLDEPFSAVDQMTRLELYNVLADVRADLACPILLVTHDLNEARLLADEICVLDQGVTLQQGKPESIYLSPRNARVADLVGIQNRFVGEFRKGGKLSWGKHGENPWLTVKDKGRIENRAEVAWVIPAEGVLLGQDDGFPATVQSAKHLGDTVGLELIVELPQPQHIRLSLSRAEFARLKIREGQQLPVSLDANLIHIMPLRPQGV